MDLCWCFIWFIDRINHPPENSQFDPENHQCLVENESSNPYLAGSMFLLDGNGFIGEMILGLYYLAYYYTVIYGNMPLHWLGSYIIMTWILTYVPPWVQSLISLVQLKRMVW